MDNSKASPMSDDLSALAWVYEELRKSLESAHKALQRALKESGATGFSDVDALDPAILRNARQQIHQGVGALELAGLPAGAMLLRASEAVVQRFVNRPQSIHIDGVKAVESASFALLDLMRRRLAGKPVSVLALFPQYEALLDLAGTELARPSDLWIQEWPAVMLETPLAPPAGAEPREVDADAVNGFELALLKLLRSGQPADARPLVTLCSQLAAGAHERQAPREAATWVLACGFLEAIAEQRLDWTVHVKRVLSALLSQLRTLTRQGVPSDRLAHELLFFCAQAAQGPHPAGGDPGRVLDRLREAFHLDHHAPVDLAQPSLGRFDPAWVSQAAKRVSAAKEGWSAVAAGELLRLGGLNEQFSLVADSLKRLYPDGEELASALTGAVSATVQSGQVPESALAMEVATGLLYLDASLDEAEFEQPEERQRVQRLAHRIRSVHAGEPAEPLESWMEALYRHVSDRQTIGSVVQELRTTLGECEKRIDQFFRDPETPAPLLDVPSQLQSMKGVLAVLGLDAAAHAVSRMRGDVDALLLPDADHEAAAQAGVHDRLASNLGAVGFLVDMLAVQPGLAKNLFVFDEASGVLAPIMGRAAAIDPADVDPIALMASPSEQVERVRTQEVAETLVESAVRDDVPLRSLSDELQVLADTPLVQEQADLAASVATAQAALERAADHIGDEQVQQQARDDVVAALNDFVQSVSEPMGLDPLPDIPADLAQAQAPLVPFKPTQPEATGLEEDDEMRDIFIEEAREVVADAQEAVQGLQARPDDISLLTTIRRAFHTLKGSSRMVGLNEFGEAGWACEQLYNTWLASQQPASADLQGFTAEALDHLGAWVEAIDARQAGGWSPQGVVQAADTLRLEQRRVPIQGPDVPHLAEGPVESIEVTELSVLMDSPDLPAQAIEAIEAEPAEALVQTEKPLVNDAAEPSSPATDDTVDLLVLDLGSGDEEPLLQAALAQPDEVSAEALGDAQPPALSTEALAIIEPEALPLEVPLQGLADDAESAQLPDEARTGGDADPDTAAGTDHAESSDEQVKVIGPLRISIPLFNIYLNEADEQSRRLSVLLSEWALEWHRPLGDEAIALAHSLAGNSGAVGYAELSQLARLLEHELTRSQALAIGDEITAGLFSEAAEEIRRLLHQFAAGFLKSPHEELMRRLAQFETQELPRHDPRGHLRLVHSADEAEAAAAAEPIDQVTASADDTPAVPPLDLPSIDSAPSTLDETGQPLDVEPLADLDLDISPADQVPAIDAAVEVVDDDADAAHSMPAPLGLPELRPFEPLPDTPRTDLLHMGSAEVDLGEDADIDAVDAVDADLFPIFEEEALELLPQLAGDMRQWGLHPAQAQWADASMRTLHTFKGGARLAGAMRLGELAHRMESAIERLMSRDAVATADVEPLLARLDVLAEVFEALQRRDLTAQQEATAQALAVAASPADQPADLSSIDIGALPPATADASAQGAASVDEAVVDIALLEAQVDAAVGDPSAEVSPIDWSSVRQDFVAGAAPGAEAGGASVIATVRVRPRLLDRLVNHAGEVSIARTRLSSQVQQMRSSVGDLTENLERLRQQLRDIELQAETQLSTRMEAARAQQQNFDPLEFDRYTRFQELTRMMAESVNDVATVQRSLIRNVESAEDQLAVQSRLTRDLQEDLLRTRMVEFEGLSDRLYRVVRQAAKETGKQVRLDIVGGHAEVDRGVLERMTGAFEHLLRNSVTHGIEAPAVRQAAGKEPMGAIVISVHHEGNEVSIEFRDDGAGLNLARIREKALAQGLIAAGSEPTEAELSQMIFMPGFSTADAVTELAGRGVGMDVVRADVNAMGGRIETATAAGQGTSFRLVLPLTTAVTKVVMVRCGEMILSIPTNLVELVRRVKAQEIDQSYTSGTMAYGELTLPFFWLGALLQHSPRGTAEGRSLPVVVVRSAQQRVCLHVDEVLGNQDVVVKNLGPQLSRVPGLAGMTLLASGAIALIYNPVALATVYGSEAQQWAARAGTSAQAIEAAAQVVADTPVVPLVLVVDDSLTVRRVTQRLLTREGYRVTLAKDGLEALEKLAEETPLVVLSDIEMPRMDGFDLLRNIRNEERWKAIPVVMITSRIAQKHRDYAMELGANHYLGKPYSEEELVGLVGQYTQADRLEAAGS